MFLFSNFRLVIVMYCNTVNFQLAKKNESKRRKEREREKKLLFFLSKLTVLDSNNNQPTALFSLCLLTNYA